MRRYMFHIVCALLALGIITQIFIGSPEAKAQQRQNEFKVGQTPLPGSLRIAVRESRPGGEPNPRGRILYVMDYPFETYIRNVLPNEWLPSWEPEALKAGALAIKMFAWYHALNPVTIDNQTFAVDNTVNFQVFREGTDLPRTNAAFDETINLAYVEPDNTIIELNYRAGYPNSPNPQYRNAQKMAQHGSQYLAETQNRNMLQILQYYYENRKLVQFQ
ncbi:SpoIID/LytB domain-containing protein [Aneurinibacillus tyrosinisolvens]|uniref:SpoIID/LytB domain-containing protein n=1 Tax=Aneurinibacillus tyrosinisolvens TaxID=1443435 RepID=UPI00063F76C9|nr:SpoIID/LytB domain-containing protein [Aneurinibacillus tyrosinisolvens]